MMNISNQLFFLVFVKTMKLLHAHSQHFLHFIIDLNQLLELILRQVLKNGLFLTGDDCLLMKIMVDALEMKEGEGEP